MVNIVFNILVGFCLIFFKTDLNFIEIGTVYYLTNFAGYISIYVGIKELAIDNKKLSMIKPYVVFMIFHSILFLILNITGNSPAKIAISTMLDVVTALTGIGLMIAGMFMILYIIQQLLKVFRYNSGNILHVRKLDYLYGAMLLASFLACFSFVFNFIPMLAEILMGILLLLKVSFLIGYYQIFLTKKGSVET